MSDAEDRDIQRTAGDLRLALGRLVRRIRTEAHLPTGHAATLGHLARVGPMTTSELAQAERVRQQSMARTVGQLLALGQIEQRPHPTDGRKLLLSLTDAGRTAIEEQRGRRAGWLAEAMADELTAAEQATLRKSVALLERLAAHGDDGRGAR